MAEPSRYDVPNVEAGIKAGVLKNKLGLISSEELSDRETLLLSDAYNYFLSHLQNKKLQFNLDLIFQIHEYFLGPLYDWAGKVRTVDISKDGILFVPAKYLPTALKDFEKILATSTIASPKQNKKEFAEKLAIIHC